LLNKKLYSELNNLEKVVEEREDEIAHLNKQLDTFYDNNLKLENEKSNLEKKVYDLSETNHRHVKHIERLESDLEHHKNTINKKEFAINTLENEKVKLNEKIEDLNGEIRRNQNHIKQKDESLYNTNKNLEDSKKTIQKLQVRNTLFKTPYSLILLTSKDTSRDKNMKLPL